MKPGVLLLNFCLLISFAQAQELLLVHSLHKDTVVPVSDAYADPSLIKCILLGKNYRSTWAMPVRFPVFFLSMSHLQMEELGGSKQTNSLYLRDGHDEIWVLRSVDKDVRKAYPFFVPDFPVVSFKQDLISANYPYGALVAAGLVKAAGIEASQPVYYFVADEPALGDARQLFANTVCLLEKREPGKTSIDTDSLKILLKDTSYTLDKKQLLQVRITDMFIGDGDRHEGQFRWAPDSANKRFHAIPRDRDFAFFSSRGLIPLVLEVLTGRPKIHFTGNSGKLKKLNHKAWEFDKAFIKDIPESAWQETAESVVSKMTDEALASAVHRLPDEILAKDGDALLVKLKSRRNNFVKNVMVYRDFLLGK